MPPTPSSPPPSRGTRAGRMLWMLGGALALLAGLIGLVLPLLPTVPFLLLAAWCFSHGCVRCERWLREHPRFGPPLREWREHRALTLRTKQLAIVMMAVSAGAAWWLLSEPLRWAPAVACTAVGIWMWRLPTRPAR